MTIITGPAWYAPVPTDQHVCVMGPAWAATVIAPSDQYSGIAKIGTTYVATGRGQAGVTPTNTSISTDLGATWAAGGTIPNYANTSPFNLRAGNGRLVAYMSFGGSCYSTDAGVSWAVSTPGLGFSCASLVFGNGLFVYVDSAFAFTHSSATGLGVTSRATPAIFQTVWWNGTVWIGFEASGVRTWTSPDLVTWTLGGSLPRNGSGLTNDSIAQNDNAIVIGWFGGVVVATYSLDYGATWTDSAALPLSSVDSMIYGNGLFLAVLSIGGQTIKSTDNGATWTLSNFLTMTKHWYLAYDGENNYLAVGSSGADDTVANVGVC